MCHPRNIVRLDDLDGFIDLSDDGTSSKVHFLYVSVSPLGVTTRAFHKTIGFMKCMDHVDSFIKCSDKTKDPYKMQTHHFWIIFYEMPRLYNLQQHTRIVYGNMRPYKMQKPLLTIPHIHKTPTFYEMPSLPTIMGSKLLNLISGSYIRKVIHRAEKN